MHTVTRVLPMSTTPLRLTTNGVVSMPGVIEVRGNLSIGQAIEDILLLVEFEEEWRSQVRYIPLG